MPAYKDTVDDFNLKWAHTYVMYHDQPIYLHGAHYANPETEEEEQSSDEIGVKLQQLGHTKSEIHLDFKIDDIVPIMFNSHFYNRLPTDFPTGPICLFVARSARRQNKRSISDENTYLTDPLTPIYQKFKIRPESLAITFQDIVALLQAKYPSYGDALDYCNKFKMIALSPDFVVSLSTISTNKYLLANQFGFIGEADANNLYVHHQGSLQEVNDFVYRTNLPLRVLNAN